MLIAVDVLTLLDEAASLAEAIQEGRLGHIIRGNVQLSRLPIDVSRISGVDGPPESQTASESLSLPGGGSPQKQDEEVGIGLPLAQLCPDALLQSARHGKETRPKAERSW